MEIEINIKSSEPVYRQIVNQITRAVQSGQLNPGYSLPPVRQLAGDLMINPNTVAKAYKQLEIARIVFGAGRKGTFIADQAKEFIEQANSLDAKLELGELLKSFNSRGIGTDEIKTLLINQVKELKGTSS